MKQSIRGLMANVEAGLMFKFQFNPSEIRTDKKVNYDVQDQPGWSHPILWYRSNGERIIEFNLICDATEGSKTFDPVAVVRPYGVEDVIATLESFKLPEEAPFALPDFRRRKFIAPPDCYFVFGLRWAKTKLLEAPITESIFSATSLTPQRFSTQIKLVVIEEGTLADMESMQRKLLARFNSLTSGGGVA